MSIYLADNFTDTTGVLLSAHTPTTGTSWVEAWGAAKIAANAVATDGFTGIAANLTDVVPVTDYEVSAILGSPSGTTFGQAGVIGRWTIGSSLYYQASYDFGAGNWYLTKGPNSTTMLGTYAAPFAAGATHTVTLRMIGTAISLLVDGAVVISATDTDASAAGVAGIHMYNATAGDITIDNLVVQDPTGGSSAVHVVTGRGVEMISSPAWLRVEVAGTFPPFVTAGNAEPPNYYHVGMISWGTARGAMQAYPISRTADLVMLPPGMVSLWYEFATGLTVTITERSAP